MFDSAGNLVVAYFNMSTLSFGTFNATSGQPIAGPFAVASGVVLEMANSTVISNFAAINSHDEVAFVYATAAMQYVHYQVRALNGSVVISDSSVNNASSYGFWSPSIAIGTNDTINIVSENYTGPAPVITYSKFARNGTPLVVERTLVDDGKYNQYSSIAYDAGRRAYVVSWYEYSVGPRVLAIDENGTTLWGPVILGNTPSPATLSIDSAGNCFVTWAANAGIYAAKISAAGSLLLPNVTIAAGATRGLLPRSSESVDGHLLIVWPDSANSTQFDLRIGAFSRSTLAPDIAALNLTSDPHHSDRMRFAVRPDGLIWVVWTDWYLDASFNPVDSVLGAPVRINWSGFSVASPSQNLTMYRGEPLNISLTTKGLVQDPATMSIAARPTNIRGPPNWSLNVSDLQGNDSVSSFEVAPLASVNLTLAVVAPVADPVGYGTFVAVTVTDLRRPVANVTLVFNLTVIRGHAFGIQPPSQNATTLPGTPTTVSLFVSNVGNLSESAVPLQLSPAPPAGWTALLSSDNFTGAPGSSVQANVTVTPPLSAASTDSYCSRLRVQGATDPFSLASAGLCIFVQLVAAPGVDPPNASASLAPGETIQPRWNLTNTGNAGAPITCRLAFASSLPQGWSSLGLPASLPLAAGDRGTVNFSVTAPTDALGFSVVTFGLLASCDGSSVTATSNLTIDVLVVRSLTWSVPGTGQDANPNATFVIRVANAGNIQENVSAAITDAPPGWSVQVLFPGSPMDQGTIAPFSSSQGSLQIAPGASAAAGTYRVNISLIGGFGGPYNVSFTVGIPRTQGLYTSYSLEGDPTAPGGNVTIGMGLVHTANGPDGYLLTVLVSAPEVWRWSAAYAPSLPGDASTYGAGVLTLAAFSQGTLRITLTGPANPSARSASISIRLTASGSTAASFDRTIGIVEADLTATIAGDFTGVADPVKVLWAVVTITNQGDGASGHAYVRLTLDGATLALELVGPLAPHASMELRVAINATPGPHILEALADPKDAPGASPLYGAVFESDETNNGASQAFTLESARLPDDFGGPNATAPRTGGPPLLLVAGLAGAGGAALGALVWLQRRKTRPGS